MLSLQNSRNAQAGYGQLIYGTTSDYRCAVLERTDLSWLARSVAKCAR